MKRRTGKEVLANVRAAGRKMDEIKNSKKGKAMARVRLKEARRKAGMTQKEVAEYLHVGERHYKKIESGETLGSIDVWDALEDLFKVNQRKLREIL